VVLQHHSKAEGGAGILTDQPPPDSVQLKQLMKMSLSENNRPGEADGCAVIAGLWL